MTNLSISTDDIELYNRTNHILNNVLGSYSIAMREEKAKDNSDDKLLSQYQNVIKTVSSVKRFIVNATPKEHKLIAVKYAKIYRENIERKKNNKPLIGSDKL